MLNPIVHSQFEYYRAHQDEFVAKYNGKVIVMVNHEVVGAYENDDEAYLEAVRKYPLGTFMIQLCTPGREAYTVKNYSPYYRP